MELLRPILELGVVIPGMLLAYFPAKSSLKQPLSKLVLWLVPLLALLCAAGGVVCYARRMPTAPMLAALTLLAVVIYIKTLRISLWKSGTIALSVCAVFACINSLSRAINAAMLAGLPQAQAAPWFCLRAVICYHALCWLFAAIAYYPATHSVRRMVEDENFAQTWYVFWVLPQGQRADIAGGADRAAPAGLPQWQISGFRSAAAAWKAAGSPAAISHSG